MSTTVMGIMGTLSLITTIWVLYDVWAVNKSLGTGSKILWSLIGICFNIIGAAAYYFLGKNKAGSITREDTLV